MHIHPQGKADDVEQGNASADWPSRFEKLACALEDRGRRVMALGHIDELPDHASPLEGVATNEQDALQKAITEYGTGNQMVGLVAAMGADMDITVLAPRLRNIPDAHGLSGAQLGRTLTVLFRRGHKWRAESLARLYAQIQAQELTASITNKEAVEIVMEVAGFFKKPLPADAAEPQIIQSCLDVVLACELVAPGKLTESDWDRVIGEVTRLLKGANHPALVELLDHAIEANQVPAITRLLEAEPQLNLSHPMNGDASNVLHALLAGSGDLADEEDEPGRPYVEEIIRLYAAGVPQLRTEWLDDAILDAGTPDQSLRWLQVMGRHGDRELVQMNAHQHRVLRSGDPDLIEALQEVPGVNAREVQALAAVLRSTRTTKHWHH